MTYHVCGYIFLHFNVGMVLIAGSFFTNSTLQPKVSSHKRRGCYYQLQQRSGDQTYQHDQQYCQELGICYDRLKNMKMLSMQREGDPWYRSGPWIYQRARVTPCISECEIQTEILMELLNAKET